MTNAAVVSFELENEIPNWIIEPLVKKQIRGIARSMINGETDIEINEGLYSLLLSSKNPEAVDLMRAWNYAVFAWKTWKDDTEVDDKKWATVIGYLFAACRICGDKWYKWAHELRMGEYYSCCTTFSFYYFARDVRDINEWSHYIITIYTTCGPHWHIMNKEPENPDKAFAIPSKQAWCTKHY